MGWVFYSLGTPNKYCLRYPKDWDHVTLCSNSFSLFMVSSASVAPVFTAIPQLHRVIGSSGLARETEVELPKATTRWH